MTDNNEIKEFFFDEQGNQIDKSRDNFRTYNDVFTKLDNLFVVPGTTPGLHDKNLERAGIVTGDERSKGRVVVPFRDTRDK